MSSESLSEQPPLERAVHRLREAQEFHDNEEYDPVREDMALDAIDDSLEAIREYVEQETWRIVEDSQ